MTDLSVGVTLMRSELRGVLLSIYERAGEGDTSHQFEKSEQSFRTKAASALAICDQYRAGAEEGLAQIDSIKAGIAEWLRLFDEEVALGNQGRADDARVFYVGLSGNDPSRPNVIGNWDPLFSRWPQWSELAIYSQVPENGVAYNPAQLSRLRRLLLLDLRGVHFNVRRARHLRRGLNVRLHFCPRFLRQFAADRRRYGCRPRPGWSCRVRLR